MRPKPRPLLILFDVGEILIPNVSSIKSTLNCVQIVPSHCGYREDAAIVLEKYGTYCRRRTDDLTLRAYWLWAVPGPACSKSIRIKTEVVGETARLGATLLEDIKASRTSTAPVKKCAGTLCQLSIAAAPRPLAARRSRLPGVQWTWYMLYFIIYLIQAISMCHFIEETISPMQLFTTTRRHTYERQTSCRQRKYSRHFQQAMSEIS